MSVKCKSSLLNYSFFLLLLFRILTDLLSSVYINKVYLLIIIIDNEGGRKLPFRIRYDLVCLFSFISYTYKYLIFCYFIYSGVRVSGQAIVRTLTFDSTQNDFIFIVIFDLSMCVSFQFFFQKSKKQKSSHEIFHLQTHTHTYTSCLVNKSE